MNKMEVIAASVSICTALSALCGIAIVKTEIKKYFKKYYLAFMKCENISLKNKISVPIFFLFPFLYNKFRKMTDKTL